MRVGPSVPNRLRIKFTANIVDFEAFHSSEERDGFVSRHQAAYLLALASVKAWKKSR